MAGKRSEAGDQTSEINSLLKEFPASTNILVVDPNLITLLNMKKIMKQYGYQVTVYSDAEEAFSFLKNCKHEINIVIWDFDMPGINGLEALQIIGSEMNLPVVIMSDDNPIDAVMQATIHGSCDYVVKPVREEVIAIIWKHIVRKRMMSKPGLIPHIQSDPVPNDGFKQDKDDSKIAYQDNGKQSIDMKEEKAAKKPRIGETQPFQLDLVQTNGVDQDNDDSKTINQYNGEENMDKKKPRKLRMKWTEDLHQKFLKAIEIVGGPEKANPKSVHKCLQDMNIEGLTRSNVASHLQKHRINLEEKQIRQNMPEIGLSSLLVPNYVHTSTSSLLGPNNVRNATSSLLSPNNVYTASSSLLGPNNVHTATSSLLGPNNVPTETSSLLGPNNVYAASSSLLGPNNVHTATSSLMNGRAINLVQQNQYPNGYLTMNNNQFMSNPLARLPYFDDQYLQQQPQEQQQQQYQLPHQLDYVMSKKEPEQAYGITDHELIYPSSSDDPNDFFSEDYSFNQ